MFPLRIHCFLPPHPGEGYVKICRNPKFIVNTANANDLDQGYLGNCWFIAGCAAVTFMPELFDKVVPKNQELDTNDYAGIFHFRFWIYGFW